MNAHININIINPINNNTMDNSLDVWTEAYPPIKRYYNTHQDGTIKTRPVTMSDNRLDIWTKFVKGQIDMTTCLELIKLTDQ